MLVWLGHPALRVDERHGRLTAKRYSRSKLMGQMTAVPITSHGYDVLQRLLSSVKRKYVGVMACCESGEEKMAGPSAF